MKRKPALDSTNMHQHISGQCLCATLLCMLETLYPEPKAKKYFDNPYLEKKKRVVARYGT